MHSQLQGRKGVGRGGDLVGGKIIGRVNNVIQKSIILGTILNMWVYYTVYCVLEKRDFQKSLVLCLVNLQVLIQMKICTKY